MAAGSPLLLLTLLGAVGFVLAQNAAPAAPAAPSGPVLNAAVIPRKVYDREIIDDSLSVEENTRRIRDSTLYPYEKHLLRAVSENTPIVQSNLRFPLPFFGFLFNYTWISLSGHLAFSYSPARVQRPLKLPIDDWPYKPDPSFIGPFHMEARIGTKQDSTDIDPGVYVRIIPYIGTAQSGPADVDKQIVAMEENAIKAALIRDLQEGMIGVEDFEPKHALIVTWRNVSVGGGLDGTDKITNSFQVVVATDEYRTYCMFNYDKLTWTSSTQAGGGPGDGESGTAAFVGFNAGNGTRAFEYIPYSQSSKVKNLLVNGWINNKPGRHLFRIDEDILPGVCNYEPVTSQPLLVISPETGNMLGGVLVNITGPCFKPTDRIRAKFKDVEVLCQYRSRSHASCITPRINYIGYVEVWVFVGDGAYQFKTVYYLEPPDEAKEIIWFRNRELLYERWPLELEMAWSPGNLTWNRQARVQIGLWGYRERNHMYEVVYIDSISEGQTNTGTFKITPSEFATKRNWATQDVGFGFIQINLTNPTTEGLEATPTIWSRPIPLAWYFVPQWINNEGTQWARRRCDAWYDFERRANKFAHEVPRCPCTRFQALADKSWWSPDTSCDMFGNSGCYLRRGAQHCVRSALPTKDGAGQQCCYDQEGYLMMNVDTPSGGTPARAHPFGGFPYNDAGRIPSLSHWNLDTMPYLYCCFWQSPDSEGCHGYQYFRASQDCRGYQPPNASVVFGDPHFVTFDNTEYSYNGLGEYVLAYVDSKAHKLEVQGRFEQVVDERQSKRMPASELSSIAARDNISATVEVQLRNIEARWRYRLNVLVDHKRVYFDRPHLKVQTFRGVTVYVPGNIHNQSQVVIQFSTGAGIEVIESIGHMAARIFLPRSFMNITKGLLGNWSGNREDDLMLPNGEVPISTVDNVQDWGNVHRQFGLQWVVKDSEDPDRPIGKSLFFHEFGRTASGYYNETFQPIFQKRPTIYSNTTLTDDIVERLCSMSYQCTYDYIVSENRDFAKATKFGEDSFKTTKEEGLQKVISCGALQTPRHGRKSAPTYIAGASVKFACDPGYVLVGEPIRWCFASGDWSYPNLGVTDCVETSVYQARQAGMWIGIALGILFVLGLLACIFFAFRGGYAEDEYEPSKSVYNRDYTRGTELKSMNEIKEKNGRAETDA